MPEGLDSNEKNHYERTYEKCLYHLITMSVIISYFLSQLVRMVSYFREINVFPSHDKLLTFLKAAS